MMLKETFYTPPAIVVEEVFVEKGMADSPDGVSLPGDYERDTW